MTSENHRPWREVLGFVSHDPARASNPANWIEKRYRELASKVGPDKPGGSFEAMAKIKQARDEALVEIGNS